jgi:general secretion pathway protein J
MTRRDRNGGFALIESIAVLALSSLVLLTLVIATDIVARGSGAAARRANDLESLSTGFAALRRDIEGALHVRVGPADAQSLMFVGRPDAVGIVVPEEGGDDTTSDSMLWIEAEYEDERGLLRRSSTRLLPETQGFTDAAFTDPALLLTGPWRYRFSFADAKDGTLRWLNRWNSTSRMPVAIRLEVLSRAGSRRIAPPLVVRVRTDSDGQCIGPASGCEEPAAGASQMEEGNVPAPEL